MRQEHSDLLQPQHVSHLRDGVGAETGVLLVPNEAQLLLLGLGIFLDRDLAIVIGEKLVDLCGLLQHPQWYTQQHMILTGMFSLVNY